MPNDNTCKGKGVGGMVIVHEEIDEENHGLDGAHRWSCKVREHSERLIRRRD